MLAVIVAVVAALRSTTRSRIELAAEIFAQRHQLGVLRQRAPRRLRLGRTDRVVWVLLSRLWRGWRGAVYSFRRRPSSRGRAEALVSTGAGDHDHAASAAQPSAVTSAS